MTARRMMPSLFGVALLAAIPGQASESAPPHGGGRVAIVTSDVDRFYALYDDPALASQPDVVATRYLAAPIYKQEMLEKVWRKGNPPTLLVGT